MSGISFGNSQSWNGIRFNITDCNIRTINGINITFWQPEKLENSVINGLAVGLSPSAEYINGASIGFGIVAGKSITGI